MGRAGLNRPANILDHVIPLHNFIITDLITGKMPTYQKENEDSELVGRLKGPGVARTWAWRVTSYRPFQTPFEGLGEIGFNSGLFFLGVVWQCRGVIWNKVKRIKRHVFI